MTPHHRYTYTPITLYKQAKIVLKSVFLNKIKANKHTICGHLVTPYNLVKNFMTFPKIYDPSPVYLGPLKENA